MFAEATEKSYAPFLRLLRSFPEVKVSLHFTGILLDWLERNDPRLLELLAALVERGGGNAGRSVSRTGAGSHTQSGSHRTDEKIVRLDR